MSPDRLSELKDRIADAEWEPGTTSAAWRKLAYELAEEIERLYLVAGLDGIPIHDADIWERAEIAARAAVDPDEAVDALMAIKRAGFRLVPPKATSTGESPRPT